MLIIAVITFVNSKSSLYTSTVQSLVRQYLLQSSRALSLKPLYFFIWLLKHKSQISITTNFHSVQTPLLKRKEKKWFITSLIVQTHSYMLTCTREWKHHQHAAHTLSAIDFFFKFSLGLASSGDCNLLLLTSQNKCSHKFSVPTLIIRFI